MRLIARFHTASFVLSLSLACAGIMLGCGCGDSGTPTAPPADKNAPPAGPSQLEKDFQRNTGGGAAKSK